jgi:site-specific DNA recombinase
VKFYVCAWHRVRGSAVCSNSFGRPAEAVDAAVVGWIRENVLQEKVVVAVINALRARLTERAGSNDADVRPLQQEEARLKRETERVAAVLATSDESPEAVVKALPERENRLRAVRSQIDAVRAGPAVIAAELNALESEARRRLRASWVGTRPSEEGGRVRARRTADLHAGRAPALPCGGPMPWCRCSVPNCSATPGGLER